MGKDEFIKRYGEDAYEKHLEQMRAYYKTHREEEKARDKKYREEHPEEAKASVKKWRDEHPEEAKKWRDEHPEYNRTGIPGEKHTIRMKHGKQYRPYKDIIAPESQIHHEWIPKTSEYRGVALVEADAHMHGFVDVIEILAGRITLLTEEEVKNSRGSD
jgi:hypothetical protein